MWVNRSFAIDTSFAAILLSGGVAFINVGWMIDSGASALGLFISLTAMWTVHVAGVIFDHAQFARGPDIYIG